MCYKISNPHKTPASRVRPSLQSAHVRPINDRTPHLTSSPHISPIRQAGSATIYRRAATPTQSSSQMKAVVFTLSVWLTRISTRPPLRASEQSVLLFRPRLATANDCHRGVCHAALLRIVYPTLYSAVPRSAMPFLLRRRTRKPSFRSFNATWSQQKEQG